ncbi:MAG: hypothetical protein MUF54_19025, partial [Polyangiaceae bacterium]|nr:hypothetical protein [Polyangiaceae bacterium]
KRTANPVRSWYGVYYARLLPAHFARLRLGLRCVLKTKKRVPRAPRPNARLTNAQIADARGIVLRAGT